MKIITFIGNFAKQNADIIYSSLYIQYIDVIKNNDQFGISLPTFIKIWKNFLPYIQKLTPHSDLCLKYKDMRFNANFWSVEEKEIKVLEWHKHIKWAYKERENY
ncbi:8174_t:CDS:2, partial [Scutellospora calospora]